MNKALLVLVLLVAALPLCAQRGDFGYAMASAPYDAALDFVDRLAGGDYYGASQCLSDDFRKTMTSQRLSDQWKSLTNRLGRFQSREVKSVSPDGTTWHIHVLCTFANGKADVVVDFSTLTTDHDVLAFRIVPFTGDAPVTY